MSVDRFLQGRRVVVGDPGHNPTAVLARALPVDVEIWPGIGLAEPLHRLGLFVQRESEANVPPELQPARTQDHMQVESVGLPGEVGRAIVVRDSKTGARIDGELALVCGATAAGDLG